MIVASAESSDNTFNTELERPPNNNPHSLSGLSSLDNVRFHSIELSSGRVMDRIKFTRDYILLSNYAGVSMNGRKLAIVSLQNQLIKIYEIDHKGRFTAKQTVGHTLYGEDYGEVSGKPLLGLRQRLMSYLYRNALKKENPQFSVRLLYNNWEIIENLCISRVQFLDDMHLLIKLTCPESLSVRSRAMSDSVLQNTAFFVVYSLQDTQIKFFYRSTSQAPIFVARP
jgi:hypothetical protein